MSALTSLLALIEAQTAAEWLDAVRLAERQATQLREVVRHHAAHSRAFAERLAAAGMTAGDFSLAELPPVGRRAMQRPADEIFALPPKGHGPVKDGTTSGSTGEPVVIRRTAINQIDWQAHVGRIHRWHSGTAPLRLAAIRAGLDRVRQRRDWAAPASLLTPTGPAIVIPNGLPITEQRRLLIAFRPDVLMIYPSNLDGLIAADGPAPAFPLRQIRTIGETLTPDLRLRVQAHWDCPLIDIYSSEEVGHIALQCPDGPGHHIMADTLIVEVLDAEDRPVAAGEEGRVVITDLRNFATPIIRYDIGDRAVAGGPCPCGRGFPTLAAVLGRTRNLILMPDGSRHWPLTGRAAYRAIAPVIQHQLIQRARDLIEIRLVTERPLTGGEEDALAAVIRDALGHPFALDFHYFADSLPKGANGKLEEFVNLVDPPAIDSPRPA
jgi:phenylacetate-CoA ligase